MPSFYARSEHHNSRAHFCLVGHVRHRGRNFDVLDLVVDDKARLRVATDDLAKLAKTAPVGFETTHGTKDVPQGGRIVRIFENMTSALSLKVATSDHPLSWTGDVLMPKGTMPLPRTRLNIELQFFVLRAFLGKLREDVLEVELAHEGEAYTEESTVRLRMGVHAGMRIAHGARLFARYRGLLVDPPGVTHLSVSRITNNGRYEGFGLYTPGWSGQSALRLRDIPLVRDPRTRRDPSLGRWVVSRTRRAPPVRETSP